MTFETELNPLPEPMYYTPSIEEFHIGFPYEWLNENNDWIKEDSLTELNADGFDEQTYGLRVKYLDRSDIESLGWVYKPTKTEQLKSYSYEFFNNEFRYVLSFTTLKESFNVEIKDSFIGDDDRAVTSRIFLGDIKNKSELKRLMIQLGIIE